MKTSESIKLVALGLVMMAGGLVAYRAYKLAEAAGQGLANIPGQMGQALVDVGALVKEQAAIAAESLARVYGDTVGAAVDTVGGVVREVAIGSGAYTPPEYVKEIPLAQWDSGIRAWVRAIKTARKIKVQNVDADFIGWKFYSNGTLISPAGEYFTRDYASAANETADGAAFAPVWFQGAPVWDVEKVLEQWQQQ